MCSCDQSLVTLAFLWSKLSQPQFYKYFTRKTAFFEGWSCFKFNNLGLALGTNLKIYISVAKGLKLRVRKFWGLIATFVEVTEEKLIGGAFPPLPPSWIELSKYQRPRTNSKTMKKNSTILCSEIIPPKIQKPHPTPRRGNSHQTHSLTPQRGNSDQKHDQLTGFHSIIVLLCNHMSKTNLCDEGLKKFQ